MRTLRARLTLLYVAVTGGMFLVFGAAVYGVVGVLLMNHVDRTLRHTAHVMMSQVRRDEFGNIVVPIPDDLALAAGMAVQVWDRQGRLVGASHNVREYAHPLSPQGLSVTQPTLRTEALQGHPWRVLSEPIYVGDRRVATLQVAMPLEAIYRAKQVVLLSVGAVALLAVLLAALVSYFSVKAALEPLTRVTAVADQITHADDLSRRIPVPQGAGDEVWTLVQAFNATLSRLEALFQAQRRFIADVGHELRTPLTVIKGNAQWMRRIGKLDWEALDSIEEEADRLSRLVDDLLLLERAEAGKLPLRREMVDLGAIAADVLREMQVVAREKIRLQADIQPVMVCGDPDRLKQVLLNLVGNAIKYTPQGGVVRLMVGQKGSYAVATVQDTGPGIPPEDLPHIFERFYRADKARSRGKGFGLGLSIAYWIVKHHDGRIEVASRPGEGTTFTVTLPIMPEEGCLVEEDETATEPHPAEIAE